MTTKSTQVTSAIASAMPGEVAVGSPVRHRRPGNLHRRHRGPPQRGRVGRPSGVARRVLQRVPGELLAPLERARRGRRSARPHLRRGHDHRVPLDRARAQPPGRVDLRRQPTPRRTVEFTLPLKQFIDGGWYWFDIAAGSRGRRAARGRLGGRDRPGAQRPVLASASPPSTGRTSASTTCACSPRRRTCSRLSTRSTSSTRAPNSSRSTPSSPRRPRASATSCGMIEQGNLGGSGGFSRAMDETVREGCSDYVLVLDDDVVTEPESMLRAVTFADLARRPTIVGGHMFSLYDRSVLHAFGETDRAVQLVVGLGARHHARARFRPAQPAAHPVAAPPRRRRLQRLVDVPHPDRPRCASSGCHCRSSSSGTTPSTGCGRGRRLPDGVVAGRGRLARAVAGQERRTRLAGVLPPAQPARRGAAALAVPARRQRRQREPGVPDPPPALDAVLDGDAAADGDRGHPQRSRAPASRLPDKMGELREVRTDFAGFASRVPTSRLPGRSSGSSHRDAARSRRRRPTRSGCWSRPRSAPCARCCRWSELSQGVPGGWSSRARTRSGGCCRTLDGALGLER